MLKQFVERMLELGLEPLCEFGTTRTIGRWRYALGRVRRDITPEGDVQVRPPGRDPGGYTVEMLRPEHDDGNDGNVGSHCDSAHALLDCGVAQERVAPLRDAAFGKDTNNLSLAQKPDRLSHGGEREPKSIDGERPALVEHRGPPPLLIELDPSHPSDMTVDDRCDDDWFKVADVRAGEDERPVAFDAILVQDDLANALELDEVAHEAAGLVEGRAHGRQRAGNVSRGRGHLGNG